MKIFDLFLFLDGSLPQWASNALCKVGIDVSKFVGKVMKDKEERSSRHDLKSYKSIPKESGSKDAVNS